MSFYILLSKTFRVKSLRDHLPQPTCFINTQLNPSRNSNQIPLINKLNIQTDTPQIQNTAWFS